MFKNEKLRFDSNEKTKYIKLNSYGRIGNNMEDEMLKNEESVSISSEGNNQDNIFAHLIEPTSILI